MGIAEQTVMTSIAKATRMNKIDVNKLWKELGDLGQTAEILLSTKTSKQISLSSRGALTVEEVYEAFDKISQISGKGTVESKVELLVKIIVKATPKEAKCIIRIITCRLRLGIGDMTFLDALAIVYGGGKNVREAVERSYNMSSDLGLVSETLAEKGIEGIIKFGVTIGRPIRPMLCGRLTSAEEILKKLGGKGAVEFKYDGLRVQAHISPKEISLFSRRLENITNQFTDIARALKKALLQKILL